MLPPTLKSVADANGRWWIAHTLSRAEKVLCWDLLAKQVDYFLPMREQITFSGGRKRTGLHPIFRSYVFFAGEERSRQIALESGKLCQILEAKDQSILVRELKCIEIAVRGRAALDLYPHAAVGNRCRVTSGPLVGTEGIVVERSAMTRLVLQVSMLGQGVSLQIHPDLLEPLG